MEECREREKKEPASNKISEKDQTTIAIPNPIPKIPKSHVKSARLALEDEGEGPADPEMVAGVPPELPEMIPIDVAGDELLLLVLAELLSEPL